MNLTTIWNHCCRQLQLMILIVSRGQTQAGRCSVVPMGNIALCYECWVSLAGFELQKSHHICIQSSINFLSLLVSLMTLWLILSVATDLFFFSPEVIDTSVRTCGWKGQFLCVDHHPKSKAKEDWHWTLKMSNSILTEAPLYTILSF